jgi:hypothetical protein
MSRRFIDNRRPFTVAQALVPAASTLGQRHQSLTETPKPERGPAQSSATLIVTGLADGEYVIQRWDTLRDEILRQDAGRVHHSNYFGYGLQLTPPAFWSDIAARVIRQAAK